MPAHFLEHGAARPLALGQAAWRGSCIWLHPLAPHPSARVRSRARWLHPPVLTTTTAYTLAHSPAPPLQSGIRYPVVVRFENQNYAGVSTNNYALDEVVESK